MNKNNKKRINKIQSLIYLKNQITKNVNFNNNKNQKINNHQMNTRSKSKNKWNSNNKDIISKQDHQVKNF